MRVLDLFCGAGGASMGLHLAGFEVTGVDISPQPRYPFHFVESDAMDFPLTGYDLIWASPPCQAYTNCQRIRGNDHPDLISKLRAKLKGFGTPYIIENVVGAPLLDPIQLCGSMFGLRTYRHRLFECSSHITAPPHPIHSAPTAKMGRPVPEGWFMHIAGNFSGVETARKAMGIPWMTRNELREAIPPAYAEYVAKKALDR